MKTIAVLLTVFNRKQKTLESLERLYGQVLVEGYKVDVYLTNDGCTDGTPEAVREAFPEVHLVGGDGSLFWNRGMYTAWAEAAKSDYDYYLWLNDDTFVYSYMLSDLMALSCEKQNKAIIIGATEATDHSRLTYGGRDEKGNVPPVGAVTEVSHFNGNIVLVPRAVYRILGNLDYYFTHSKGDFDYGLRAKREGIMMYQAARCLGECDSHPTLDKWCNPEVPLKQRWEMLYRPNGMPPNETFHLEKRHYGITKALFHYFTIHLRCLFPSLWNIKK